MLTLTKNAMVPVARMAPRLARVNSYSQMLVALPTDQLSNSGTKGRMKSADSGAVYSCNCSAEQSSDFCREPAPIW